MIPKPKIAPRPAEQACEPCGCEVVDESITNIIVECPGIPITGKTLHDRREAGFEGGRHYSKKTP